jgi:sugar phosphate isomerase/epimerase
MTRQRIGLATDDLHRPLKVGLKQAAEMGFAAVEVGAAGAEINPRNLSGSARRHLGRHVRNLGLALAALGADPPGAHRLDAQNIDERADLARSVLEMAAESGAPMVTLNPGRLIDPSTGRLFGTTRELLGNLADHADRVGTRLALLSGGDDPDQVAAWLKEFDCPALRICVDPAALLLAGRDPAAAARRLADHIGLSHARDASAAGGSGPGAETSLGRGDVDLPAYLAALAEAGYAQPHIIRRRDTVRATADLAASKAYLESMMRDM